MSSTPNGPKREGSGTGGDVPRPSLDQTFLGVAPPAPARPATASAAAIVAAPVISVSGKEPAGKPARAPEPAPAQAAPARPPTATPAPANLGGGWQSAKVAPRPVGADRTLLHPTPAAHTPAGASPAPSPAARPFPRPEPPQASPGVAPVEHRPVGADSPLQRTALASDFLRAARDAAVAPRPETSPQPVQPLPVGGLSAGQRERVVAPEPAARAAYSPPMQAAPPPAARPEPVQGAAAERFLSPAAAGAAGVDAADVAPRSLGTHASIAPPLEDASRPVVPSPRPPAQVSMPARQAPRSLAGTLLEQPPSAPLPAHQPQVERAIPAAPPNMAPLGGYATRFEPVPSVRAPLGEQSPASFGVPAPGEHGPSDWSQQTAAPAAGAAAKGKTSGGSQIRLIGLATLALAAIAFATFGDQLAALGSRVRDVSAPHSWASASDGASTAQSTMANRPAAASDTRALAPSTPAGPSPSALAATAEDAPAVPTANSVVGAGAAEGTDANPNDSAASSEAQLAAAAGRHVIAGRYAEALPIYQQLQQTTPDNAAYPAMVRVLGRKVGAAQGSVSTPEATTGPGGKP